MTRPTTNGNARMLTYTSAMGQLQSIWKAVAITYT